jgi:spoIIIJ-associated protein
MNAEIISEHLDAFLRRLLWTSGLSLTYRLEVSAAQSRPLVSVELKGDDVTLLTGRNGELLLAIEHIAAKALRLEPEDHDLIRFEAGGFKANRERNLLQSAMVAIEQVRRTGKPYRFPPMSSHERRMLHLALAGSGLTTASEGEGALRHLVLHPPPHWLK